MEGNPFFEKNADKYAVSKSHRSGEDLEILENNLKLRTSDVMLDIATGTGFTAVRLAPYVRKVTASDPTESMLNQAKKLAKEAGVLNIDFLKAAWEDLEPGSGPYDIITCRRAAHHFNNMDLFFSKVYSLLKSGGKFAFVDFTTPEQDNFDFFNGLERTRDSTHVYALKVSDIERLADQQGFSISTLETRDETVGFNPWLYPVAENSSEGIKCREYLESSPVEKSSLIGFNPENWTFRKTRVIAILQKMK